MDSTKKPDFQMGADARFLYQHLRPLAAGALVTHGELSAVVGKTVNGASGSLHTARRTLLRDDRQVWASVRGVGVKRLTDGEIVSFGANGLVRIRRASRRTFGVMTAIDDYQAMPKSDQLRHTAVMSVAALIGEVAKEHSIAKIESASSGRANQLPTSETLRALGPLHDGGKVPGRDAPRAAPPTNAQETPDGR